MFEVTSQLDGRLSSRLSKGSSTAEWLRANFHGPDLRDTVYVTANPQLERNRDGWDIDLHETINVWLEDGWDEEIGTVRAETMTETAIEAHGRFPDKRIVVHYMQPHYPFVSSDTTVDKDHLSQIDCDGESPEGENIWNQKFTGELSLSQNDLWSMYVDNLEYVLKYVAKLLDKISGKTIVTADHGNYVGQRASPLPIREYGHPRGLYDDAVTRVPWLVHEANGRRKIVAESGEETVDDVESDVVAERLRNLGYKN
jgi:hypothetical protein